MPVVPPPNDLCCSILPALFAEPVFTADGHSYERKSITAWFAQCDEQKKPVTSPRTGAVLPNRTLTPNLQLRMQVSTFRESLLSEKQLESAIKTGDLNQLKTKAFLDPITNPTVAGKVALFPLHTAVAHGQLEVFNYLRNDCKMDVHALNSDGDSLLHVVITSTPAIVRCLVQDCKLSLEARGAWQRTPLLAATTTYGMTDIRGLPVVAELLKLGADRTSVANETVFFGAISEPFLDLLTQDFKDMPRLLGYINSDGLTFLHRQWVPGHGSFFRRCLMLFEKDQQRIDLVRHMTVRKESLLHFAVRCPEILEILLAPPYSLIPDAKSEDGSTALHYLAESGADSVAGQRSLDLLLSPGKIDIDAQNYYSKRTALHLAAKSKSLWCVKALVMAGANTEIADAHKDDVTAYLSAKEWAGLYFESASQIKQLGKRSTAAVEPAASASASAAAASSSGFASSSGSAAAASASASAASASASKPLATVKPATSARFRMSGLDVKALPKRNLASVPLGAAASPSASAASSDRSDSTTRRSKRIADSGLHSRRKPKRYAGAPAAPPTAPAAPAGAPARVPSDTDSASDDDE